MPCKGISVRSWCEQNDVNEKQFYYWQRKIREIASESLPTITQDSKFVQLPVSAISPTTAKPSSSEFVPSMVIRVGKAVVELADHVQPELLASVLKVLFDA